MTSKYIRPLALLLCAALLGCLLAACGGAADSSPASSAAPASDSASASGSSELPSSTTEANTGELNPGNFDENSVFSITGTENAFAPCLGWGPGVSGCSLKSVIAAASLLQWAEGARMSSRSPEAIQDAFYSWYDGLTDNQQEGFAEAWPLIKDAALDLLSDKDSMTGRIADAGLDADTLPGCTLKNWQALHIVFVVFGLERIGLAYTHPYTLLRIGSLTVGSAPHFVFIPFSAHTGGCPCPPSRPVQGWPSTRC